VGGGHRRDDSTTLHGHTYLRGNTNRGLQGGRAHRRTEEQRGKPFHGRERFEGKNQKTGRSGFTEGPLEYLSIVEKRAKDKGEIPYFRRSARRRDALAPEGKENNRRRAIEN